MFCRGVLQLVPLRLLASRHAEPRLDRLPVLLSPHCWAKACVLWAPVGSAVDLVAACLPGCEQILRAAVVCGEDVLEEAAGGEAPGVIARVARDPEEVCHRLPFAPLYEVLGFVVGAWSAEPHVFVKPRAFE